ncbi:MAG: ATP-binding protein [Bacteroidetes bacterium]|nr:ATP-binding protein [Bacteroidota bacterium]
MRKLIQRAEYKVLENRLEEQNPLIQVVVGARQVGKSTLVHQVLQNSKKAFIFESADAVAATDQVWIEQLWNRARMESARHSNGFVLAIDEIQKIHQWSETVKKCWDEDKAAGQTFCVVLLGSSKLILQQGLTESLAGRFEMIPIPHWRYHEMREAFDFTAEQYVWFGSYPGAAHFINDEPRWKAYVRDSLAETAISKDILMLNRVDKPAILRNLFETGSQYSGQILSYNKLMGQLQAVGNTTTLAHYLTLLNQAELLCGLEKYASGKVRRKASSPKFQTYNTALVNAYKTELFEEARQNPKLWGRAVESSIGAYLLTFSKEEFNLYYWREGNHEVDFILEKRDKIVALEVKTGNDIKSGMGVFQKSFHPHKFYTIGTGGIPWQDFLTIHPGELF